jgi:hypothetical protein
LRIGWVGYVVRISEEVKPEGKIPLEDLGVDGKIVLNGS